MTSCVIMFMLGFFFLIFGYLIWRFKIAKVIAGYDKSKVSDPNALATWVGKCMVSTGIAACILGIIAYAVRHNDPDIYIFISFMILSMISGVVTLAGTQRYYK